MTEYFCKWFVITHRCDVDQANAEPCQTDDKGDESFVPVTFGVTHDAHHGTDQTGCRSQPEGDQHQEEEDREHLNINVTRRFIDTHK